MSRSEGKPPTVADSTMLDDRPQAQPKKRLDDLPTMSRERYDIAGEHARGGLGVILRAHDQHLERTVAIKEIAANADDRASTRFVREALITARLQHPGIVPVYEAGRWPNGARFYAMKMVSGRTLREELKAHDDLEGRLALVPSVLAVAEAVGYAHAEGVIHRDLKPDNVMIGAFGETVVVDWGLAKDRRLGGEAPQPGLYAQAHAEATHIGAVIGTPAYMSPEQARGEDVDERADVWAIGAILYHLLAAQPPYVGAPDSVIQRVANEPAPPLADKAPGAPRDLVAIVNKAMARDAKARYANAKELAVDLSRFLTGQLVGAREYNRLARIEHWVKQHRAPVIVAAVLLAILAVTASFSIVRILEERRVAQNRSDELLLTQARSQLDRDPTAALAWIKQYPASGNDQEAARNIAADAMSRGVAKHVWRGNPETVNAMVVSPDGNIVATASGKVLQLLDRLSGRRVVRRDIPMVFALRFSPDGTFIAGGGQDGTVFTIDTKTSALRRLGKHAAWVIALDVLPTGWIVSGDIKGDIRAWRFDGSTERDLGHIDGVILGIGATGDSIMAVATPNGSSSIEIRRMSLATGGETVLSAKLASEVRAGAMTEDGQTIVAGAGSHVVQWHRDAASFVELANLRAPVTAVAVLSTTETIAGCEDGTIVRITPGSAPRTLVGHSHPITALAVAADGRSFASGDQSGDVRVWTETGAVGLRGHDAKIDFMALVAGGLVSGSDDGSVRAWETRRPGKVIPVATEDAFRLLWLSDHRVVTTDRVGNVTFVDLDGSVRVVGKHANGSYDIDRFPNGDVASSGWDGSIAVFTPDGREIHRFVHGAQVWNSAISPDGRLLASAGIDNKVKLWTVATGEVRTIDERPSAALDVAFSPDGKVVATAGADFDIRVIDLANTTAPRIFHGHTAEPRSLVFSADGRTVYSAGGDGDVRSWDVASGEGHVFSGHQGQTRTIALSRDQRRLASGGADGLVIVWDLANGGRATVLPGHTAEVRYVTFSADGHLLASAGWDGTVRLWNLDDGRVTIWRGHEGKVHRVEFSPNETMLASVGEDGTVRVWSVGDEGVISSDHDRLADWLSSITTASVTAAHAIETPSE